MLLIIPAEEIKTNKPIETELSPAMEWLLTRYQRDYLPLLAVKPGGGLPRVMASAAGQTASASWLAASSSAKLALR